MLKQTGMYVAYEYLSVLVYKTWYEALQKNTTVAYDHKQQSELCELLIQYVSYFDLFYV